MLRDPEARAAFFRPIQQGLITVMIAAGLAVTGLALFTARWIILALLIGLGLGIVIQPGLRYLHQRLKFPQPLAVIAVLALILGAIGSMGFALFTIIADQFSHLVEKAPTYIGFFQQQLNALVHRYPWLGKHINTGTSGAPSNLSEAAVSAIHALETSATIAGGLFFVIVIALYYATSAESYMKGLLTVFPAHMRPKSRMVLVAAGKAVRGWFYSQLIAMAIVGVLTSVGLYFLKNPYWFLLGALTGALELIPFFGPIVAFAFGTLATWSVAPQQTLWVALFFLGVLRVEGDLIIPWVMKERIYLPPIHLITLMVILGEWFGVLGFLAATPLLAVGRTIYLMAYVPKMDQRTVPTYAEAPPTREAG